jgi:hypothetical protein
MNGPTYWRPCWRLWCEGAGPLWIGAEVLFLRGVYRSRSV